MELSLDRVSLVGFGATFSAITLILEERSHVLWVPCVAWRVLELRMEETALMYGG